MHYLVCSANFVWYVLFTNRTDFFAEQIFGVSFASVLKILILLVGCFYPIGQVFYRAGVNFVGFFRGVISDPILFIAAELYSLIVCAGILDWIRRQFHCGFRCGAIVGCTYIG